MAPRFRCALLLVLGLAGCAAGPVRDTAHAAGPSLPTGMRAPVAGVLVSGRLAPADPARLGASGIRQVIDLTPDDETPDFDERSAVRAAGLGYANLPLRGATDLTPVNVRAFDALLGTATRPVLVHCASGNRVGAMAALRAAWIQGRPVEEAIATGRAWGLTGLEDEVRRRLEGGMATD